MSMFMSYPELVYSVKNKESFHPEFNAARNLPKHISDFKTANRLGRCSAQCQENRMSSIQFLTWAYAVHSVKKKECYQF